MHIYTRHCVISATTRRQKYIIDLSLSMHGKWLLPLSRKMSKIKLLKVYFLKTAYLPKCNKPLRTKLWTSNLCCGLTFSKSLISITCSSCESLMLCTRQPNPHPVFALSISGFRMTLYHCFWRKQHLFLNTNHDQLFDLTDLLYIQVAVPLFGRVALM